MPPLANCPPICRWAGGKRWLVPMIVPGIYRHLGMNRASLYIEPFAGGAAIALALGQENMVLVDKCKPLMQTYLALQVACEDVITKLDVLRSRGTSENNYYGVRSNFPHQSPLVAAAQFIFLNRTSFNGIYRENSKGKYNVPWGKNEEPFFPSADELRTVAHALRSSRLLIGDYSASVEAAEKGDVIFADPPYDGVEFVDYNKDGFDGNDQDDLAQHLRDAAGRGAVIITTNADTEANRARYAWMDLLQPVRERRAVNSDIKGRGKVQCLIGTTHRELLTP